MNDDEFVNVALKYQESYPHLFKNNYTIEIVKLAAGVILPCLLVATFVTAIVAGIDSNYYFYLKLLVSLIFVSLLSFQIIVSMEKNRINKEWDAFINSIKPDEINITAKYLRDWIDTKSKLNPELFDYFAELDAGLGRQLNDRALNIVSSEGDVRKGLVYAYSETGFMTVIKNVNKEINEFVVKKNSKKRLASL